LSTEIKEHIGIICGAGDYPKFVAQACVERNIDFCLVFLNGFCSPNEYDKRYCSRIVNLGEIGAVIDFFHSHNVGKIIFAGGVKRPNFKELSLDKKGASWLLKLGKSIFSGDDALLRALAQLANQEGFEIIAGTDLLNDAFMSRGVHTSVHPTESEYADIQKGFEAAKQLGALDIGQAAVVHDGLVLGVECVEGTDALLDRCAKLRKSPSGGVLVKVSKPLQDQKLDLPTVGIDTIRRLHTNKFSGLAVEVGKCIVVQKEQTIALADSLSIFICGCEDEKNIYHSR
jgi:DUF1009 family protein